LSNYVVSAEIVNNLKNRLGKLWSDQEVLYDYTAELSKKSYSDRVKSFNLPTLKYRQYRGDMIELFKIIKGTGSYMILHVFHI